MRREAAILDCIVPPSFLCYRQGIRTFLSNLRSEKTPQFIGIFFICVAIFAAHMQTSAARTSEKALGVLGGVMSIPAASTHAERETHAIMAFSPVMERTSIWSDADREGKTAVVLAGSFGGSIYDNGTPQNNALGSGGLLSYQVKRGDTLSGIARDFGISVQTIIDANSEVRVRALQIGQELKILPVSGVAYIVEEGETLESIALLFGLHASQLKTFNRSVDFTVLAPGTVIVIPGARNLLVQKGNKIALPDLKNYFVQPVQGFNWGRLHERNAVDIANTCGTPVLASAEGLVTDLGEGWNSGYGNFVLVEHPNGTKSRYAHLDDVSAFLGDYVQQGVTIGTIGNTGNVHGPTGCHLHFEVEGAQNPFVK